MLPRMLFSLAHPPHRPRHFKAVLNVVVAEERALAAVGPNGVVRAFKIACTRVEARPAGLLVQAGVRISCYPLGVDILRPAEGAAAQAPRKCLYDGIRVHPKRIVPFRRS
jgi:hypothetical protein